MPGHVAMGPARTLSEGLVEMRKVVDSNYLQSPKLRTYLSRASSNFVVLTDYAWMEAYKGNTLGSIHRSMAILCEFPRQVLILKGTKVVGTLSGRRSGLVRRLFWPEGTKSFARFCRDLKDAEAGDKGIQRALLEHGRVATEQMEKVLSDASDMVEIFRDISKIYSSEEIAKFRRGGTYTREMVQKTLDFVMLLAAGTMRRHPHGVRVPARDEIMNTFLFRHALCAVLLFIRWVRDGSQTEIKQEKIRNDLVDVNFATYATYFDGLLTEDRKLASLHDEACLMLKMMHAI